MLREIGRELLGKTKHTAFWIFNVFAENDAPRVFFETGVQCFIDCVPDPIFPGRQDFLVDLRGGLGDIGEKLVGRHVIGFLRFAVLAANALLNFIVELCEFLGRDHTLRNQLIFPALERIAFLQRL